MLIMKLTEYAGDIPSFYVEMDYIIVVRHHAMSQQLFSSNYRQLGIALPTNCSTTFSMLVAVRARSSTRKMNSSGPSHQTTFVTTD
jgi:hypothetical protein